MKIRASMLPSYPDCPRRTVAKQYRKKFEKLGYEFHNLPPSVGSAAGTAVHAGTEHLLRDKWQNRQLRLGDAVEIAMIGFDEETAPGAIWDDTTPNANAAELQIRSMITAYYHGPLTTVTPLTVTIDGKPAPAVELELSATVQEGWQLTGHMDLVTDDAWIHDTKTGAVSRAYPAQMGGYSLLVRSNGILQAVNGACLDYVKRCNQKWLREKGQKPFEKIVYGVGACESQAIGLITRIIEDMKLFDETKNLDRAFPCNQMSMMCTEKYCPAYGTDFCELTKKG